MKAQLELLDNLIDVEAIIKDSIPEKTYLYYVDYRDNAEGQLNLFQQILEGRAEWYDFTDAVYDSYLLYGGVDLAYYEEQVSMELYSELHRALPQQATDVLDAYVDELMNEYEDVIRDYCYCRDASTPADDLVRNTADQSVRIEAWSNFEGIEPAYIADSEGWQYSDHLAQAIDLLQLNPADVEREFLERGSPVKGEWPELPERQPYVTAAALVQELYNTPCYCGHLTFVGLLDLGELKDYTNKVIIPKGNCCGFFTSWQGSGSTIEMPLLRDMEITIGQYGETEHDKFTITIDKIKKCSMDDVYFPTRAFWGDTITLK